MRNQYSYSHISRRALDIGRIQTLTVMPVEAGSSLEINMQGIARLAPSRKEIVSDCMLTTCAFFVPYRIIWGQNWLDYISKGPTTTTWTPPSVAVAAAYRTAPYLTRNTIGATINSALLEGYNRILYNFYQVPSYAANPDNGFTNSSIQNFQWFPTTEAGADRCRLYGRLAARLPHILNGGTAVDQSGSVGYDAQTLTTQDQQVPVDTGAGTFNLTDMASIQGRYKSKVAAAWFAHFYQDIMYEKWGSRIGPDADPRNLKPHMLGREDIAMSGYDIDGTDAQTLGKFQGKVLCPIQFRMRRKIFGEHGLVFVLAVPRYPLVHFDEVHPLLDVAPQSYASITGDPDAYGDTAPINFNPQPWLSSTSTYVPVTNIKEPFGQPYRYMNNITHANYKKIPGYPMSAWNGVDPKQWYYYLNNEYKATFNTTQIGQCTINANINVKKFSLIPGVSSSYFAGT